MKIKGYIKRPDKDPERVAVDHSLKWMSNVVGGPVGAIKIKLRSGKDISLMINSSGTFFGLPYNFTVCPTIDKKTYFDIVGPCVIVGRDDNDNIVSVDLDDKDLSELISYPYEI